MEFNQTTSSIELVNSRMGSLFVALTYLIATIFLDMAYTK